MSDFVNHVAARQTAAHAIFPNHSDRASQFFYYWNIFIACNTRKRLLGATSSTKQAVLYSFCRDLTPLLPSFYKTPAC